MILICKVGIWAGLALLLVSCSTTRSQKEFYGKAAAIPKIIFDTDMGPDYDDVGAIAVLHALADSAECEILATVASSHHPGIAPTIELFNRYFKRADLPVGVSGSNSPDFTAQNNWNDSVLQKFAPDLIGKNYPSAVQVYRSVLAAQSDNSVTIVTVGFLSNISELLESGPDGISPLTGMELVNTKVVRLVAMAGIMPEGGEFNIKKDIPAAQNAISKWPKPILFSGFEIGSRIRTGGKLAVDISNPIGYAYNINLRTYIKEPEKNRQSWDQTAVLCAIRDPERYFYVNGPGKLVVKDDGENYWDPRQNAGHYFLVHKFPFEYIAGVLDQLMGHKPR